MKLKLFMLHYAALNESLLFVLRWLPLFSFAHELTLSYYIQTGQTTKLAVNIKPSSNQFAPTASGPKPKYLLRLIIGQRQ